MQLTDGFMTHESGSEQILIDLAGSTFHGIVRSNQTAAFIVDCLKEETTKETILQKMQKKYDAPVEQMEKDLDHILGQLKKIGAIHE